MSASDIDDETLMALADGELDAPRAQDVRRAMAQDPSLRRRFEVFAETRARVHGAFAGVLREPVPQRLAVFGAPSRKRFAATRLLPMAAAVLLTFGGGYWFGARDNGGDMLVASAALTRALSGAADGETAPLGVRAQAQIDATYRTRSGICRTFKTIGDAPATGVACRAGDAWTVRVMARDTAGSGDYRPASSAAPALDAYLDAVEASERLTPEDVAKAKANGWR
jgi:anti-sigma factor RsiW